jgi:flavin-dependent dehydrogenase
MTAHDHLYPDVVDVAVIGAGPGGSTVAAELARAGRSVLVLERRTFPRFHIGESMLPYTAGLLDKMGVLDRVKQQGYPLKKGAEFIFADGQHRRIDFQEQGPGRQPEAFQVERAHFDSLLVDEARRAGAVVLEDAHVGDLVFDGTRVVGLDYTAGGESRTVRATYVVDAGGRLSKIAQAFPLRKKIERLQNIAVFQHFTGLDESRNPGSEGDIQVGGHADGWVWAIPVWADTISIGAVMPRSVLRAGTPHEVLAEHIARVDRITARLEGTTPCSEVRIESDYCYYSDKLSGPGWFLVGDAGCFIDPIFSGGVYMAMATATGAAARIDGLLSEASSLQRELVVQHDYDNFFKTGYDTYTRLIYAFYESDYNLGLYLREYGVNVVDNPFFARALSGDFWTEDNEIAALLRAERRWDTFAPFERRFGCPVYPELDAHRVTAGV